MLFAAHFAPPAARATAKSRKSQGQLKPFAKSCRRTGDISGPCPAPMGACQPESIPHGAISPWLRPWLVAGSAALMLALVMGTLVNGLTAFFIPIEAAEGWGRSGIAAINSFGLLGLAVGSVVMGFVSDRIGIRALCLIAVTAMGACLLLTAQASALWQVYVIFFFAGALGGGALFAPLFATVGNWFPGMAGLAIGIAAAGQAVGQGGVPLALRLPHRAPGLARRDDRARHRHPGGAAPARRVHARRARVGRGARRRAGPRHPIRGGGSGAERGGVLLLRLHGRAADASDAADPGLLHPGDRCRRRDVRHAARRHPGPRRLRQALRHDRPAPVLGGGLDCFRRPAFWPSRSLHRCRGS